MTQRDRKNEKIQRQKAGDRKRARKKKRDLKCGKVETDPKGRANDIS